MKVVVNQQVYKRDMKNIIYIILILFADGCADNKTIKENSVISKDSALCFKGNALYFGSEYFGSLKSNGENELFVEYPSGEAEQFVLVNDSIYCFYKVCLSRSGNYIFFNRNLDFICMYHFSIPEVELITEDFLAVRGSLY
jgi:hypothetical protein